METLNTLENKAKFFALYFGQKVVSLMGDLVELDTLFLSWGIKDKSCRILLKPLSAITDEDASKIIELYYGHLIPFKINEMRKQLVLLLELHWNKYILYDYLRSKGYALPWMGISVEQQIEFGWIKLKEN